MSGNASQDLHRHSRALTGALVVLLVGGGYLIVRAVAGRWTGSQTATAAALATAFAALLFLPVYDFVERRVDRRLRGSQPTLDSVLADIAERSRSTSTDAPNLAGVAEAIGRGLGASSCRLTVIQPGLRDRTFTWASDDRQQDARGEAGDHVVLPIKLGPDHIGSIAVERSAVSSQRHRLLEDIADSLGTVLQVSRLGIELERQLRVALAHAEDIAASRRQAVAERDSERRTIERNLHDGAQHHLVSLRLAVGLVEHEVGCGEFAQARDRLGQLATQIGTAQAVLAETAAGVSSIMLSERGLIAALNADLSGAHPPIVVASHGNLPSRRFPPEIEAAVYFCCLEAVNNARKHAAGAPVEVQIREVDGTVRFTVRDEGPGFDSATGSGGRGLRNVTARLAAVGGKISISSIPGVGTTIEGSVPLPPEAPPIAGNPTTPSDVPAHSVLGQVREVVREARELYNGSAESERLGELEARLNEPIVGPAQAGDAQRAELVKARSALQVLDDIVRAAPRGSDRATCLLYQLERIRAGAHELTEIDLIDELRSGALPLADDERQAAEQLLGAAGAQPWVRLGLGADADTGEVRLAAWVALARWQHRASHPGSTRAVRNAAEVLVRTCEELLEQASPE
ncbi:MAG TPA: ATP-binding protein [Pseudonocardiaceae bacterium]